jgi:hypothetical protein
LGNISRKYEYGKTRFSRISEWNSNSSFRLLVVILHLIQEQQNNMTEHLGQMKHLVSTARGQLGGAGTQASALAFGGDTGPGVTAATEEWTGAGAAVTQTITVS